VIAIVGARELIAKSRAFSRLCSDLKHFRRVGSDRKTRYLESFRERYSKLKSMLEVSRIFLSVEDLLRFVALISPRIAVAVVDDKLYRVIEVKTKIREGSPKPKYMDNLMVVADNLANYFRILLKNRPERFEEELGIFEK